MTFIVQSPLSIPLSKKKSFTLNLNTYRNAHHFILNTAKIKYKEIVLSQIQQLPKFKKVSLIYTFYPNSKRHYDVANVCSIVDKFFCDALVELGHLPDDNYEYLPTVTYKMGCIDKDNPRVEIQIKELKMNHYVELSKDDIESAICEYVRSKATIDGNIHVELTTKPKIGITAVAVISPKDAVEAPTEETPKEEKPTKTDLSSLVDEDQKNY